MNERWPCRISQSWKRELEKEIGKMYIKDDRNENMNVDMLVAKNNIRTRIV